MWTSFLILTVVVFLVTCEGQYVGQRLADNRNSNLQPSRSSQPRNWNNIVTRSYVQGNSITVNGEHAYVLLGERDNFFINVISLQTGKTVNFLNETLQIKFNKQASICKNPKKEDL